MTTLATLPDGREIHCVNRYEVDFSVHEIFNDSLRDHGIDLPHDGVFVDVGANIGLFSLHLLDLCPEARVLAYEPMPEAFAALALNLAGRAEAFELGLGATPGSAEFVYFPGVTALSSCHRTVSSEMAQGLKQMLSRPPEAGEVADILDKTGGAERMAVDPQFIEQLFTERTVQASIDTLGRQIERHGIERIDLLKIDTEGAEKEVLAGLRESDWPRIRQLIVEVHLGRAETEAMDRQLRQRGFQTRIGDHPLSDSGAPVFHIYAKRIP